MNVTWYEYVWRNNPVRAKYFGHTCRVLVRATRMGSVLVEFGDGFRMVTSARALRAVR